MLYTTIRGDKRWLIQSLHFSFLGVFKSWKKKIFSLKDSLQTQLIYVEKTKDWQACYAWVLAKAMVGLGNHITLHQNRNHEKLLNCELTLPLLIRDKPTDAFSHVWTEQVDTCKIALHQIFIKTKPTNKCNLLQEKEYWCRKDWSSCPSEEDVTPTAVDIH